MSIRLIFLGRRSIVLGQMATKVFRDNQLSSGDLLRRVSLSNGSDDRRELENHRSGKKVESMLTYSIINFVL